MAVPITKGDVPVIKFGLEPYTGQGSRHYCPNCNKKGVFTRYIDLTTGSHIGDEFGICNRKEKCGYSRSPKRSELKDDELFCDKKDILKKYLETNESSISIISPTKVVTSMTFQDNFSKFLISKFSIQKVYEVLAKYKVGESNTWFKSTVFWQIDQDGDVRTGKIILYNSDTGKRVKDPFNHCTWEHCKDKYLKDESYVDYNLKQVYFGSNLVTNTTEEVNIVESEKTAIICSIISDKVWLAVGGIEMISEERLNQFKDKRIVLHPDKGEKAFTLWNNKIQTFKDKFNIRICDFINKTDLLDGEDLADYILNKIK